MPKGFFRSGLIRNLGTGFAQKDCRAAVTETDFDSPERAAAHFEVKQ